jgi:hypothetical protein
MPSTISQVILPELGPVCPECCSRGYVPGSAVVIPESYTFATTDAAEELEWNVHAARAITTAHPRPAQLLDPTWLLRWLAERAAFTLEHLDHIPSGRLAEPGILVHILADPPRSEPFRVLIDGTHRLARRLLEGRACWAYSLTEEEQQSICTARRRAVRRKSPHRRNSVSSIAALAGGAADASLRRLAALHG